MKLEYRVTSKRAGCRPKALVFRTQRGAIHRLRLLGPEPWTAYGLGPDDIWCSGIPESGMDDVTQRQYTEDQRSRMPALEWVKLEVREVDQWFETSLGRDLVEAATGAKVTKP